MPNTRFQTLLVDSAPRRRRALERLLAARRGRVASRTRRGSAVRWLESRGADLVLVSTSLPGHQAVLERAAEAGLDILLMFRPRPDPDLDGDALYLGRTRFGNLKFARQVLQACGTWWELQSAEAPVHERYRKLLNRVHDGMLELGPDDTIRWANAAMVRAVEADRLEGRRLEELVEEQDVVCLRAVREQQRGGVIAPFLVRLRQGPPVEVDPTPRFGPDGTYLGTSALIRLEHPRGNGELAASRDMVTLYSVASALSRAFGLHEVLQVLVDTTLELGGYDSAGVFLQEEGVLQPALAGGDEVPAPVREAVAGFCSRLKPGDNVRVVRDPEKDPDPAAGILMAEGFFGLAAVNLTAGTARLGVLWALGRSASAFNRERNSLLISMGSQAGVAVQNARHLEALLQEEAGRRRFYRDALQAVTKGKLVLTEYDELEEHWAGAGRVLARRPLETTADVPEARKLVERFMEAEGFEGDATFNLVTCVSEAATNVVKYGAPGSLEIRADDSGLRVRMDDVGPGIEFANLPSAVLMPGFSTAPSLGLGFTVLLELCDRVHLATSDQGTRLILEMARQSADPLDAFVGFAAAFGD